MHRITLQKNEILKLKLEMLKERHKEYYKKHYNLKKINKLTRNKLKMIY